MPALPDLLTPISGDNPAGTYLRYDPLYDQIKEARREDDDLPQGDWQTARKVADWTLVIRLASDALTKRTKDVQIAAWLTEALLRRDGIAGLREGLAVLHELLQQFWDQLYPPIEDGDVEMRAGPLEWVGRRFDVAVRLAPLNQDKHSFLDYRASRTVPSKEDAEQDSAKKQDRERAVAEGRLTSEEFEQAFLATPKIWYKQLVADLDACLEVLRVLDRTCEERFGADAPSFLTLQQTLQEIRPLAGQLLIRKLELDPDPVEVVAGADGGANGPATDATPAAGTGSVSLSSGPRSREEAAAWISAAAQKLRQEQPSDPSPYLMLRGFRWGELRASGDGIDPKLLAAPTTEVRTRLRGFLLDGKYPELLETGEQVMAQPYGRGWLDLQRYILTACDALGSEYHAVGVSVRSALRALLADIPTLPTLTLMDDSPTANAETLAWLRDSNLLPEGTADTAADVTARPSFGGRDVYEIAQDRARAGDARGAMELLMREAVQERSARARFLRRAQAANVMVNAGMEAVALPILRELLEQVEAHRLEDWEAGDTVAGPLSLLYRCLARLDSDEVDRQSLYTRICRLDPVQALQLGDGARSEA